MNQFGPALEASRHGRIGAERFQQFYGHAVQSNEGHRDASVRITEDVASRAYGVDGCYGESDVMEAGSCAE
jgi:hypothetical protein